MTDPSDALGHGDTPPRRPDPGARRAQLDALRATRPAAGADAAAPLQRRRPTKGHAALASRVLVTGLAAGTTVGLVGVLAQADTTQQLVASTGPAGAEAARQAAWVAATTARARNGATPAVPVSTAPTTTSTLPATTAAPSTTPATATPTTGGGGGGIRSTGGAGAATPTPTAPPATAPPATAAP
ncbi:MAG: hypothetical protein U0P45_02425 [Acidimicrobiales bacterium]